MNVLLIFAAVLAARAVADEENVYVDSEENVDVSDEENVVLTEKEESLGPVVRTGRYRVLEQRILGNEKEYPQPLQLGGEPFVQGEHPERPFINVEEDPRPDAARFVYDGPNDGKGVFIYRKVHTPVFITDGVIKRVGPTYTVDRWAEVGQQGAQPHTVEVFNKVGNYLYADGVVPVKNVYNKADSP